MITASCGTFACHRRSERLKTYWTNGLMICKFDMQTQMASVLGFLHGCCSLHFVCQAIFHLTIRIKQTWVARETKKLLLVMTTVSQLKAQMAMSL